jgi:hypothetical protein
LAAAFVAFMAEGFGDRVIGFDSACAVGYATARNAREAIGQPVTIPDALIAGPPSPLAPPSPPATSGISRIAACR